MAKADADVVAIMLDNGAPHKERVFVAGDTLSNQIARLRERAADAYREGNKPLFRTLDAEADNLESRPRVKPHWEVTETADTEGEYWQGLGQAERREYLATLEIIVYRDHIVIGERGHEDPWI